MADRVDVNRADCIFCSIVLGVARSWNVYEDESTVAFLDIGQATPGHTIVVPRDHADDIWALSEDDAARIMRSVHRVAHLLRSRLGVLAINIVQSNGRIAWQEVFHYHVHVIPGYGNDGLVPPWRSTSPTDDMLSETQYRIVGDQ